MPYDKQVQKLIGDGVNLLPPADLIAEGEAEKCQNFRVDMAGKLMSRDGYVLKETGYQDWVHDVAVVESPPANRWYVGAGTRLYRYPLYVVTDPSGAEVVFKEDFFGLASMHSFLWVMNQDRQGRDDGYFFYPWLPDPPDAAPTVAKVAGNLSGAVKYYVTFSTAREYESNPTTVGDVITASAEISDTAATFGVTLSAIPVSADTSVTKRHIYRMGGKLPSAYLVRTIEDNTTTSITDDGGDAANDDEADATSYFLTDAQAIDVGLLMEDDHDPPPACFGLAGPYNERLLAFNSADHPNRLWYTPSAEPWRWPGAATLDGNWVDIGEELEAINAISVKPHLAIIYKQHSIWRLVGDFEDGLIERITDRHGLRGPRAWAAHGLVDYFRGNEGIFLNTGDRIIPVSEKVSPIFKFLNTGLVEVTKPALDYEDAARSSRYRECMAIHNDRLHWCYTEAS